MTRISVDECKKDPANALGVLLRYLPLSLCVREIMRLRALAEEESLESPLLDVGCGDGLFWEVVGQSALQGAGRLEGLMGIDVNPNELKIASLRLHGEGGIFRRADISGAPAALEELGSGSYPTILANCSLEHVRRIDMALKNLRRLQKDGGRLYLFVPAPRWSDTLWLKRLLSRVHPRIGALYGAMWDGFFQHYHLYPHFVWRHLLESSGYAVETLKGIGSRHSNRLFDRWVIPSFPAFLYKEMFKKYPLWYSPLKRLYVHLAEKEFLEEIRSGACIQEDPDHDDTVEYFIVCKKNAGDR